MQVLECIKLIGYTWSLVCAGPQGRRHKFESWGGGTPVYTLVNLPGFWRCMQKNRRASALVYFHVTNGTIVQHMGRGYDKLCWNTSSKKWWSINCFVLTRYQVCMYNNLHQSHEIITYQIEFCSPFHSLLLIWAIWRISLQTWNNQTLPDLQMMLQYLHVQ